MDFKDYYKVLGVTYDASQSSIERAYMRQLPTYMSPVNRLDELNEAYRVLHDVSRRTEYDNELKKRLNERDIALGNATSAVEYNSVLSTYPQVSPMRPVEPAKDPEKVDPTKPVDPVDDPEKVESTTPADPVKDPGKADPTKPADPAKDPEKVESTTPADPVKDPEKVDPTKPADPAKDPEKKDQKNPDNKDKPEDELGKNKTEKKPITNGVKTAIMLGSFFTLGLPGTVIAGIIIHRHNKKCKLYRKDKGIVCSDIQSKETKLIEESNKRLEEQIDKLLSEPHNSYKLEASKIRYANEIELLKARIELKRTQKVKKGQLTKYKLELAALDMQLERANKNLKDIEQKISSYDKEENGLKRINDEIVKVQGKLDSIDPKDNKRAVSIKRLEIRKSALEKKRDKRAKGFKLVRKPVNAIKGTWFKGVDYLKGAVDVVRGNYSPEEEETENVKTR